MNRKKLSQALIALALVMLLLVGCGGPARGRIEGTVTLNGDVTKPIANVNVELMTGMFATSALEEVATTVTDSQGKYFFKNVGPGSYMITAYVQDKCMVMEPDFTVDAGAVVKQDFSLPCRS